MSASREQHWQRLGEKLEASRVALDPRYKNLTLFAAERGIDYRLAWDLEHGARVNYRRPTLMSAEVAYGWRPGSVKRVLAGGEPAVDSSAAQLPAVVRDHWDDENVRTLWGLNVTEAQRLSLVEAYLDEIADGPAVVNGAP